MLRGPPSGEVANGWGTGLNSDTLELSHSGQNYTPWISSEQYNGDYDTMALTISVPKSQLDYDHDGIFSNEYEGISLTDVVKTDAFTATMPSGTPLFSDMKAYAGNIPEPSYSCPANAGVLFIIYQLLFIKIRIAKRVSGK